VADSDKRASLQWKNFYGTGPLKPFGHLTNLSATDTYSSSKHCGQCYKLITGVNYKRISVKLEQLHHEVRKPLEKLIFTTVVYGCNLFIRQATLDRFGRINS